RSNPMYAYHRAKRDPLDTDYAIYSPGVPVFRDDGGDLLEEPYTVGMITCAAVNANHVPAELQPEIVPAMRPRILKVLSVGIAHRHDAIVLGAWGCGAFGNDGHEIARLFRESLAKDFRGAYRRVVFAILDWSPERRFIGPFEKAFKEVA
ncbi:MAG TPA: TIGR02452 family protein, partial [Burkholderiales bacterium]